MNTALIAQLLADGEEGEVVEQAVETTVDLLAVIGVSLLGAAIGVVVGLVVVFILRMISGRHPYFAAVRKQVARKLFILIAIVGAWIGFARSKTVAMADVPGWVGAMDHAFLIAVIIVTTWTVAGLVTGLVNMIDMRLAEQSESRAARAKTQTQILHRLIVAIVWLLGAAAVLLTFPEARAAGASIFASAGIISVVAGLAAQTTLGNVFAGLQLAFTDSIRVGDIINFKDEYTTVEEITLTYVVLAVWDGRRIIVPSTILTTEAFENWTRRQPEMTGTVEWEVDWSFPVEAARQELQHLLNSTDLWDGVTGVLQVSDAAYNGNIIVRALVSAGSSPELTDLRNYVREEMVQWIQNEAPHAFPRARRTMIGAEDFDDFTERNRATQRQVTARIEQRPPKYQPNRPRVPTTSETEVMSPAQLEKVQRVSVREHGVEVPAPEESGSHSSALFTGSPEAEERARQYSGPGDDAFAERELTDTEETAETEIEDARGTQEDTQR